MPWRRAGSVVLAALLACGGGAATFGGPGTPSPLTPPTIERFTADAGSVFVGDRGRLTAVFSGDGATIDGIGRLESGVAVDTPPLARTTTFTLVVRSGAQQVEAPLTVAVRYRDRLRQLAPSPVGRTRHLAAALPDGGALIMGGNTSETPNVPDSGTTQRFDAASERLSAGPTLAFTAQAGFTTAVRGGPGQVLLVGAGPNSPLGAERSLASQSLDPTGQFVRVGNLALDHRAGGAATALGGGRVLETGGDAPARPGAEVHDPVSGKWEVVADLLVARRGHSATLLPDGRILIAGGVTCCVATGEALTAEAELYDPVVGSSRPTGSLTVARGFHEATLLADGRVLVSGGLAGAAAAPTTSTELYDPATGAFGPAGDLQVPRVAHASILLTDGRVLILGGLEASPVTELFDAALNRWTPGPRLEPPWAESTATMLEGGKVLIFGGEDAGGFPVSTVLLYE